MKKLLRALFSPILNLFESGNEAYDYKPSNRIILIIIGWLFSGLAILLFAFAPGDDLSFLFPVIVFGGIGLLALLIGFIGTDHAVSKIWGSRK